MKNIQVNLTFQANTQAAIQNINQLNSMLSTIASTKNITVGYGTLQSAAQAAQSLQIHLNNAVNTETGRLNLNTFTASLAKSNLSLRQLSTQLLNAGTQGQQAFLQLGRSIASAEAQTISIGSKMKAFGTTMLNTVKWQVASTLITGIVTQFSKAVDHAQNLNKALTDIRIVTGYSLDKMSRFADKAREAAKTLNTTSTEFAEASLIFFQQGLQGDAVTERASVVTKMAQVTGQSMEKVSDQMTAVWNNFYDGSESLEYYADAIVKLGAATASSSDEIMQGLEKFAAVGETVGLSFEYATAALATVVAETRQSPEVIGTAFKTLFARMQDLKLGNSLEDGTTLGQYSKAMAAVGVNIKDANDNLKDMDVILDELGTRWAGLERDQQVALAKQVAGLRQYNQFIALMSNYDYMQDNIELARESEGELAAQADRWKSGWEGASARVKNSMNSLYETILDDKAVVAFTDGLSGIANAFTHILETGGGLKGLLVSLAIIFSSKLVPVMMSGFTKTKENLMVITGLAERRRVQTQHETAELLNQQVANGTLTSLQAQQAQITSQLINLKASHAEKIRGVTASQKIELDAAIAGYETEYNNIMKLIEKHERLRIEAEQSAIAMTRKVGRSGFENAAAQNIFTNRGSSQETQQGAMALFKNQEAGAMLRKGADLSRDASAYSALKKKEGAGGALTEKEAAEMERLKKSTIEYKDLVEKIKQEYNATTEQIKLAIELQEKLRGGAHSGVRMNGIPIGQVDGGPPGANVVTGGLHSKGMTEALTSRYGKQFGVQPGQAMDASMDNLRGTARAIGETQAAINTGDQIAEGVQRDMKNLSSTNKKIDELKGKDKLSKAESKELKNLEKQQKALTKSVIDGDNAYKKFQKTMGVSSKAAKGLFGSTKEVTESTLNSAGAAGRASTAHSRTRESLIMHRDGLSELNGSMIPVLEATGMTEKELNALIEKEIAAGTSSSELAEKLRLLGEKGQQTDQKMRMLGGGIQGTVTAIGSVAGAATSAFMAFNMFEKFGDKTASTTERLTSLLMGLTMVIPIVSLTLKGYAAVKRMVATAEQISAGATNTNTIALIFNKAVAAMGVWGVLAAVAAIGIFIGVMVSSTMAVDENTQAMLEQNEAQTEESKNVAEATDKWLEKAAALDTVAQKYKKLKEAGEGVKDVQQEILDSTKDLIDGYEQALKTLTKTGEMSEHSATMVKDFIKQLENAVAAGDVDRVLLLTERIDKLLANPAINSGEKGFNAAKGALAIGLSNSGATVSGNAIDTYERLQKEASEMEDKYSDSELAENERYKDLSKWLSDNKDKYDAAINAQEDYREITFKDITTDMEQSLTDVTNYSDYVKYRDDFIKRVTDKAVDLGLTAEEATEAAIDYLQSQGALSEWTTAEKVIEAQIDKYGETRRKTLDDIYNKLSEEDKKYFSQIDLEKYHTQSTVQWAIERQKEDEKAEKARLKANNYGALVDSIKDDMTQADWETLRDSDKITWGQDGIVSFEQFMSMSTETQQQYLENLKNVELEKVNTHLETNYQKVLSKIDYLENKKILNAQEIESLNILKEAAIAYRNELAINTKLLKEQQEKQADLIREQKELKNKLNNERDPNHEINEVIDDLTKELNKLDKAKSRVFGKDKLKYMAAEQEYLEYEVKAYDKLAENNKYLMETSKKDLSQYGLKTDELGNISNYYEIQQSYLQRLGAIGDQNSSAYKNLEQEYNNMKEVVSDYEKYADDYESALETKLEKERAIIDKKMEMLAYEIEVEIEVDDLGLERLERLLKDLDDTLYDSAKQVKILSQQTELHFSKLNTYRKGIRDILSTAGASEEEINRYFAGDASEVTKYVFTEEQMKQLKDLTKTAGEEVELLEETANTVTETLTTVYDSWLEKIKDVNSQLEIQQGLLENYKNIIDIVGQDYLGIDNALMASISQASLKVTSASLKNIRAQISFTNKSIKETEKLLEQATKQGNEEDIKKLKEVLKQLNTQSQELSVSLGEELSNGLTEAVTLFETQMENAFEELEKKLGGIYESLEEASSLFDQQQTVYNNYLSSAEQLYELSKINRQLTQEINKTTSLRTSSKLKELQQEITQYQAKGTKMSQYEVEALQKKIELRLAEIALEDAQNAKSQVRLKRNAEGGMSYVYSSNTVETDKAAQDVEDKLEELRKLGVSQTEELTRAILDNRTEAAEAIKGINRTDYKTDLEYQEKINETLKFYNEQEQYYITQLQSLITRNSELYKEDYQNYSQWAIDVGIAGKDTVTSMADTYEQLGINSEGWVIDFHEYVDDIIKEWERSGSEGTGSLLDAIGSWDDEKTPLGQINKALTTFKNGVQTLLSDSGTSFENLGITIQKTVYGKKGSLEDPKENSILAIINSLSKKTDEYKTTANTTFTETAKSVKEWQSAYSEKISAAKNDTDQLYASLDNLNKDEANPNPEVTVNVNRTAFDTFLSDWNDLSDKTINLTVNTNQVAGIELTEDTVNEDYQNKNSLALMTGDKSLELMRNILQNKELTTKDFSKQVITDVRQNNGKTEYRFQQWENLNRDKIGDNEVWFDAKDFETRKTDIIYNPDGKDDGLTFTMGGAEYVIDPNNNTYYLTTKKDGTALWGRGVNSEGKKDTENLYVYNSNKHDLAKIIPVNEIEEKVTDANGQIYYKHEGTWNARNVPGFRDLGDYLIWTKPNGADTRHMPGRWTAGMSHIVRLSDKVGKEVTAFESDGVTKKFQYFTSKNHPMYLNGEVTTGGGHILYYGGLYDEEAGTWDHAGWYRETQLKSYDTGGYTGSWGPEGRLAVLHQKEIVLNEHDTENILSVVDLVRKMASSLDFNTLAMSNNLANLIATANIISTGQRLDQNVTITAEFPNATNKEEIKEAFGDLVNLAAQYANRK